MNDEQKMKISQEFISLHKEKIRVDWIDDLLNTYWKLQGGDYGAVHEERDGEYWIEIRGIESGAGNPVIFEWSTNA